ncbi:hypothetical protein D3C75_972070 [compost metagenome]
MPLLPLRLPIECQTPIFQVTIFAASRFQQAKIQLRLHYSRLAPQAGHLTPQRIDNQAFPGKLHTTSIPGAVGHCHKHLIILSASQQSVTMHMTIGIHIAIGNQQQITTHQGQRS